MSEKTVTITLADGQQYQSKHGFTTTVRKIQEGAHVELLPAGRLYVPEAGLLGVREDV